LGKPRSFADIVALVAKEGLYYPPGSRFVMNLSDHTILGYALERMTGKPYTALLSEWILAPLGLRQTGMGRFPGDPGRLARIPAQERWDQEGARIQDSCSPDAGLYSTADDLAAFLDALAVGRLVKKDSFRLMQTGVLPDSKWTNGKGKIGLGVFVMASGAFFNQGRWGVFDSEVNGYHALFFRDPRYDLTIILLANKWNPVPDDRALGVVVPAVYADLGLAE
jgi:D-alanyl-D-alanine carboxypeptidase